VLLVLLGLWMTMCLGIREATFGRHDPTPSHLKKASLGTHMRAIYVFRVENLCVLSWNRVTLCL